MPLTIKRSPGETIITDRPMIITIEAVNEDGSISFLLEANNAAGVPAEVIPIGDGRYGSIGPTASRPVLAPGAHKLIGRRPNGEQVVVSLTDLTRSLPADIEWLTETPLDRESDEQRHARQVANSTAGPASGSPAGRR